MANATVSLATTSLAAPTAAGESVIRLASLTGIVPKMRLYVDREMMTVVGVVNATAGDVQVIRGGHGTASQRHSTQSTVYIGRSDQFYDQDPVGMPLDVIAVYPWINVLTGTKWVPMGDEAGPGLLARQWSPLTDTPFTSALGVLQHNVTADIDPLV